MEDVTGRGSTFPQDGGGLLSCRRSQGAGEEDNTVVSPGQMRPGFWDPFLAQTQGQARAVCAPGSST